MGGPALKGVGETKLLRQFAELAALGPRSSPLGPGDDAAGLGLAGGGLGLWTIDSLVEGIDFGRDFQGPYQLGRKAWRVAASDLAAMGARPEAGLAAALLPPGTSARAVAAIQLGLVEAAAEDGASLVGGDLSATAGPLALTVSAWAQLWNRAPVRLGGGRAGEALIVTGALGGAAGALALLQSGLEPPSQLRARLCDPPSRGAAGEALARAGASAMTDLSDGLVLDLGRLCASSGQGAELWLDHLPLEAELADRLPDRARELALSGGEDFELLASLPRDRLGELRRAWSSELPALSEIGELSADPGVRLWSRPGGEQVPAPGRSGFRHF